uniref:Pyruvate kinase n=1 Tax=Glossina brevipalpis TaxID=37001 RepID=A0A1A9X505_9MUSC
MVKEVGNDHFICVTGNGNGLLDSPKRVNLPDVPVNLPTVSEHDKKALIQHNFGLIHITDGNTLTEVRKILGEKDKNIKIISKLETSIITNNMNDIMAASNGIMVARGEWGIEIPQEMVFLAPEFIIACSNKPGKSVICAT